MKSMRKSYLALAFLAGSAALLNACAPVGVAIGAGAAAGSMALEERGFQQSLKDKEMMLDLTQRLSNTVEGGFLNVSVNVIEGRVFLTGTVKDQQQRLIATEESWKTEGAREVLNELQITEDGDFLDVSRDLLIKTNLTTALTFDEKVHAVNYHISVVNGTV
ncbi:MAG: BON domain-containing protein, partial [Alphaproteobacteria bacterium]|nr:BON domain-containing protein [Alphaproteobacteria bacterium]